MKNKILLLSCITLFGFVNVSAKHFEIPQTVALAISTLGLQKDTVKNNPKDKKTVPQEKTTKDTLAKTDNVSAKIIKPKSETITNNFRKNDIIILLICIGFFIVILYLLYSYFEYLKRKEDQRIGYQSIKLIGLILIFPGICIIALVGGDLISGSTLAALLGTIAGYALSKDDDSNSTFLKKDLPDLKKANAELLTKIEEMEKAHKKEIEELKKIGK